ncbi:MAG TPA: hypothetical protein VMA77_01545 [Solirubrobacteraceae bacterium]|nr:hypothetical protein [Solirubrobacteraceae bacterium]HUA43878.1 hypothetical protein [Solirubrobacteraceae bacterium]
MKLRSGHRQAPRATRPEAKPVEAKPASPQPPVEPAPRMWSLLLPPAFTNDRR